MCPFGPKERDHNAGRKKFPIYKILFAFERVLEAADSVLDLARNLVGLSLRLELDIPRCPANNLLDSAFDLFCRSGDSVLVHDVFLQIPMKALHGRGLGHDRVSLPSAIQYCGARGTGRGGQPRLQIRPAFCVGVDRGEFWLSSPLAEAVKTAAKQQEEDNDD
jgi:hypothetical protein